MLADRQDLVGESDADQAALGQWLNAGAVRAAMDFLGDNPLNESHEVMTLFEDEQGVIVGSTNRSFGYVHLAGWLKPSTRQP